MSQNHWYYLGISHDTPLWVCGYCGSISPDMILPHAMKSAREVHRESCNGD